MPVKLQLSFTKSAPQGDVATICLVGRDGALMPRLDGDVAAQLIAAMTTARFKGKAGKSLTVHTSQSCFILIGVGDELAPGAKAEDVGGALFAALEKTAANQGWLPDQGVSADSLADICFGATLASYHFNAYFTGDQGDNMVKLSVGGDLLDAKTPLVVDRQALAEGVFLARDLVFEPANKLYPEVFAARCLGLEGTGLKVEVLDEPALKKLGMGALLGVGQGSRRESRVVVMQWHGGAEEAPIALIGKGVTFDTGGISLKPAKGMEDMKWDMGGAAAVTGAMYAIAGRKLPRNVIGIIGLVENMPDGNAQRPGDVVTSMAGKTIEVINTDAEGRLVLADIMHYAQSRFAPQAMVDLATLTGAIIGALGKEYAGLFTNSDELAGQLAAAGDTVREAVWRMPMGPAYDRMLKSHIADVKNIGGPYGGAITAACFLGRFVDNVPWAHLDIAGKAWSDAAKPTVPKGGTGYGVRLLNRMVDEWRDVKVTDAADDD